MPSTLFPDRYWQSEYDIHAHQKELDFLASSNHLLFNFVLVPPSSGIVTHRRGLTHALHIHHYYTRQSLDPAVLAGWCRYLSR